MLLKQAAFDFWSVQCGLGKRAIMQDDAERFNREHTRVQRLRWIGIGIELILAGVGCIIAGVFFTARPPACPENYQRLKG